MATQLVLTNTLKGSQPTTNLSHDGDLGTYDSYAYPNGGSDENWIWGISGGQKSVSRVRFQWDAQVGAGSYSYELWVYARLNDVRTQVYYISDVFVGGATTAYDTDITITPVVLSDEIEFRLKTTSDESINIYEATAFGSSPAIYKSPGTAISPILDAGDTIAWNALVSAGTTPSGTTVTLEISTSDDLITWSAYSAVGSAANSRFAQVRITLTGGEATPTITDMDLRALFLTNYEPTIDVASRMIPPVDDTYWIGELITPFKSWKGLVLKDTTDGNHYSIVVASGVLTATAL